MAQGFTFQIAKYGFSGDVLKWVENYLAEKHRRVVLNGSNSNLADMKAGVPEGSILRPLLFILYINDIVTNIESQIKLFADDTSIFLVVDDPMQSAVILNLDLEKIHRWAHTWLVNFNL